MRKIKKELECIDNAVEGILSAVDKLEGEELVDVVVKCAGSIQQIVEILKETEKFTTISRG